MIDAGAAQTLDLAARAAHVQEVETKEALLERLPAFRMLPKDVIHQLAVPAEYVTCQGYTRCTLHPSISVDPKLFGPPLGRL